MRHPQEFPLLASHGIPVLIDSSHYGVIVSGHERVRFCRVSILQVMATLCHSALPYKADWCTSDEVSGMSATFKLYPVALFDWKLAEAG